IDQSTTIWAVSPPTNTWRTLAFSGRPRFISRWNWAAISVRSVMVRPSFATNTASGAYKAIIASTLPELNRSISDGMTPSGSVGSGKDSDIRDLLFGLVEPPMRHCSRTNANDRLPLDPLGRIQGGDRIGEWRDGADV